MRTLTVNYAKRDGRQRGRLVNVGFFLHDTPRLLLRCRLLGHKPVVDGTTGSRPDHPGYRWVCCDRCGIRGEPQGHLDPAVHAIGDRYLGNWTGRVPTGRLEWRVNDAARGFTDPGPLPSRSTGKLGGQLVVGRTFGGEVGFEVKVGNCGSEHTLAATLYAGHLFTLYLHTERHGTGLQRWLNPVGYDSRLISLRVSLSGVRWRLWSKRDGLSVGRDREPWWCNGEIRLRPLDRLLGVKRYEYADVGEPVGRFVRMPERDYLVSLKLQRCILGRRRGRKRYSWSVDWSALGDGIPTKAPERGRVFGSGVNVSDRAVRAGTWPAEAVAAIAAQMTTDRTGYGWEPIGRVVVDTATVAA